MKKSYTEPTLRIIEFSYEDIITDSPDNVGVDVQFPEEWDSAWE